MAIVLIGFMGAGKTTAARSAAAELDGRPLDADAELEQRLGMRIEDWFSSHGEDAFRQEEEAAVLELLSDPAPDRPVVALGGGAVASERVQAALADHTVVLLDVDPDTAWQRAGGRRPLARDRRRFEELHAQRLPLYERLADAILPGVRRETLRHALPAIAALAGAPPRTKLLWAESQSGTYPVYVADGLIGGEFWPLEGSRFTVTDTHVGPLYAPGADCVMEAGESNKTLATTEGILRMMAAAGVDHDAHVAAVGGGVVGDVAGFCAAIYQRGIGVVQVPTTLVAQVDSAYGGKTGVDLPEGKNYAGAYHQPSAVLADPRALRTLPEAELAAGWAEVVKTALIAGGELWRRVRDSTPSTPVLDRDLVIACARTKLAVVAADERDTGRRQALNLGHTVGHAIETVTGYRRYLHGEAVALGLLAALTLSNQPRLRGEVRTLLAGRGLPTTLDPGIDVEEIVAATARDKKKRGGRVGYVLVDAPGDVISGVPVPDADLRAAVAELR